MHAQNRTDIHDLTDRLGCMETVFFGAKDDPEDNGLKGDIKDTRKSQKLLMKAIVGLIVAFVATRYPDIAKAVLEFFK